MNFLKKKLKNLLKLILEKFNPKLLHSIKIRRFKKILPVEFLNHLKRLNSRSLTIDLGANVGLVSEILAQTGSEVIAFEPNTNALSSLYPVADNFQNILVKPYAAGVKNQTARLFLHKDTDDSNDDLTQSSSLKEDKPNVSSQISEEVKEIDFAEFIGTLNRKIDLIKIDIEGYEVELINHLLDKISLSNIEKIYVETHERKFDSLKKATDEMKKRIEKEGLSDKFFFDWH